ncbi:MAG: phosphoribosylanthranilate isomerase [Synergistaceae bacterium]|nr:phosphoribosylanthranilate isomerase [Synergistaceae bacterium]
MKIKICGLSRECDIDYVNEALPDYAGFVFAESRRKVSADQAYTLKRRLDPAITAVGVFVDQDITFISELLKSGIIDIVQLHGHEDEKFISAVCAPVIKAVRIGEKSEIGKKIDCPANYLLFDSPSAGSGKTFDWSLIPRTEKPFFLAGGINIGNISAAMETAPYAIDVSSGVETGGVKDRDKILEIVRSVRNG